MLATCWSDNLLDTERHQIRIVRLCLYSALFGCGKWILPLCSCIGLVSGRRQDFPLNTNFQDTSRQNFSRALAVNIYRCLGHSLLFAQGCYNYYGGHLQLPLSLKLLSLWPLIICAITLTTKVSSSSVFCKLKMYPRIHFFCI